MDRFVPHKFDENLWLCFMCYIQVGYVQVYMYRSRSKYGESVSIAPGIT